MVIFSEFIENIMEVFMDDFSINGSSFDDCFYYWLCLRSHDTMTREMSMKDRIMRQTDGRKQAARAQHSRVWTAV